MQVNLVEAKTILIKTNLPGSDFVVNPYNGCSFGCVYCYAAQIARWHHPGEKWGTFLDVKVNAPELLEKELLRLEKKLKSKNFGSIFFSSVTDPYLGLESKYELTRKCLLTLADFGYAGKVAIQTKSPLVTRDIDILKRLKDVAIGFTVTTLDDKVSQFLETNAPPVSSRLKALEQLHQSGIPTYAFIGPILPYFVAQPEKFKEILDKLEEVGVTEVWFEHLNLSPLTKFRLYQFLQKESPSLIVFFEKSNTEEYRDRLEKVIQEVMKGRNLRLGLGKVIHHRKLPKKK
ncbi:MAG: radical SAM protein [Patescibacteria group bacterium]|nr:radical SAM protein [Patescibacteria group bacterium]